MKNRLRDYFPSIWTEDGWMEWIQKDQSLQETFEEWQADEQKEFLDACTGVQGIDVLQGGFFRPVMDEERLCGFLSSLFGKEVRRLYKAEGSSDSLDYACLEPELHLEFADGQEAVAQIWKAGTAFLAQQCASRSAQLLVSQYRKKQEELGKKFRPRNMGKIYTIVLLGECPAKPGDGPDDYVHWGRICFDTGLDLDFLQEYYLLNLDFHQEGRRERGIQTKLEGWMAFLGCRHPEEIVQLIKTYPCFKGMYEELYSICRDGKAALRIFQSEIKHRKEEQARCTVEEMEETIDTLTRQHEDDRKSLERLKEEKRQKEEQISRQYQEAMRRIEELEKMLS